MTSEMTTFGCLVAGKIVEGERLEVINPATEKYFAAFHIADEAMVDIAIDAATIAFSKWRKTSLGERRVLLSSLADIVSENASDLAHLLTLEQGKPLSEARQEVGYTEFFLRHFAAYREDQFQSLFDRTEDAYFQTFSPLGIVAGIIPWNFPLMIAAMKIGPALLTGNAIIIKPAPTTPATTMAFARLCSGVVPAGLIQVLGDGGAVGPMLTAHPGVRKISFTGSTVTGRRVMQASAPTLKRLNLELGGNDPAIILDDADPVLAAASIYKAAFANAGQICGAAKRIYVQNGVYEPFCEALIDLVRTAVVGNGLDPHTTLGPVQNSQQYEKANGLLNSASANGAERVAGLRPVGNGYFVSPTLLFGLAEDHPVVTEEQFAPILPVQKFADDADAVGLANATPYGLTASVWSRNQSRAEEIALQIDASLVCINRHNENPLGLGFSMTKQSGAGWMSGDEGVKEFVQPHLVYR